MKIIETNVHSTACIYGARRFAWPLANFFQKEGFMNINFKKNCKLLSGYQKKREEGQVLK